MMGGDAVATDGGSTTSEGRRLQGGRLAYSGRAEATADGLRNPETTRGGVIWTTDRGETTLQRHAAGARRSQPGDDGSDRAADVTTAAGRRSSGWQRRDTATAARGERGGGAGGLALAAGVAGGRLAAVARGVALAVVLGSARTAGAMAGRWRPTAAAGGGQRRRRRQGERAERRRRPPVDWVVGGWCLWGTAAAAVELPQVRDLVSIRRQRGGGSRLGADVKRPCGRQWQ